MVFKHSLEGFIEEREEDLAILVGDGVDTGLVEKVNLFGVFLGVVAFKDLPGELNFIGDPGGRTAFS